MNIKDHVEQRFWEKVEARFLSKIKKTETCWLWCSHIADNGYAHFSIAGHPYLAHRVAYELWVGPIPEGAVLDHVKSRGCRHRHCVNPAHLEPVTQVENIRRGDGNPAKVRCPRGHLFAAENNRPDATRLGRRSCLKCFRELDAASHRRQRARRKAERDTRQ